MGLERAQNVRIGRDSAEAFGNTPTHRRPMPRWVKPDRHDVASFGACSEGEAGQRVTPKPACTKSSTASATGRRTTRESCALSEPNSTRVTRSRSTDDTLFWISVSPFRSWPTTNFSLASR